MDLDSVADELYGLPPDEFTPARNARAGEARSAGDRELAAAIKKLRRPTTGAWLVNLLVRQHPEQVAELIDLGAAMRQAQAELAGNDLRRLSRQRRQVVGALSNEARQLVHDLGRPLSEASARELEATLEAAIADPGAAGELRRGRLTSALRYSGFGPVGLTGSTAAETAFQSARGWPPAKAEPSATGKPPVKGKQPRADRRSRERLQAAQRELRAAEAEAAAADREAAKRERRVRDARTERDRLRRQLANLERRLRDLREAEEQAEVRLLDAEEARDAADRKARGSRDRAARARTAPDRLTPPGP